MATTTNYGWTTPDNTALVKDGASAIRTLGSSIDTTLKAQIDAQIPDSLLTTTGDTIYASGASTPARLGIGTTGQVLTVSGGVPTWATAAASGGITLISTTALSGTSVTISSIPSTYKNLVLVIQELNSNFAGGALFFRFNGDTGSNYAYQTLTSGTSSYSSNADTDIRFGTSASSATLRYRNSGTITIKNYTSSATKHSFWENAYVAGTTPNFIEGNGNWTSTSAITSITIGNRDDTLSNGSILLYGES